MTAATAGSLHEGGVVLSMGEVAKQVPGVHVPRHSKPIGHPERVFVFGLVALEVDPA